MRSKTIQIYLKNADPEGIKIAQLSNSTASIFIIPRIELDFAKTRPELSHPAIYMLFDDERTSVYIGECENFISRVKDHDARKTFWHTAVICTASGGSLNKAKVKFLESHAVQKAIEAGRYQIQNVNAPTASQLHEFEQETVLDYFADVELLLATLGFNVFEPLKTESKAEPIPIAAAKQIVEQREYDTIVSPCSEDGFERAFVNAKAWWAVRIGQNTIPKLKYLAVYEAAPVSAIRAYARITSIEPYPDKPGYYKINHDGNIQYFEQPIKLGKTPNLSLQGSRYYKLEVMLSSRTLAELTDKSYGTKYAK